MNNSSTNTIYCPKCGMKHSSTKPFCIHCGYNFSTNTGGKPLVNNNQTVPNNQINNINTNMVNNNYVTNNVPNSNIPNSNVVVKKKRDGKDIAFLVVSTILAFTLIPGIITFGILWLIFGAFSGDAVTYYGILLSCCGVIFALADSFISSIFNFITRGKFFKKCIISIFVAFVLGLIAPFAFADYASNYNKNQMTKSSIEKDKVIYQDGVNTVTQNNLEFNKKGIDLYLTIEGTYDNRHNYLNGRVDRCYVSATLKNDTKPNTYIFHVDYRELKYFEIDDVHTVDFYLRLKDSNGISKDALIKVTTNSKGSTVKRLMFKDRNILYKNDYFKIYYNRDYSGSADVYFESLKADNYNILLNDLDFDTTGYVSATYANFDSYDYTIYHTSISFYPCEENLSYLKGKFKITDSNNKLINEGIIDQKYNKALLDKSYCSKSG